MPESTNQDAKQLRNKYRQVGLRSGLDSATFRERCAGILMHYDITPADAKAAEWVKAASLVSTPCGRCAGTGQFITMVVNGRPTGPGGICFRCEGKGYQTDADRRRNYGYDNHAPVRGL